MATWNPTDCNPNVKLSGGNLVATGGLANRVGCAIDLTNKLVWFYSSSTCRWNGSNTANPATATGGISFTNTGPYFPMFSADGCTVTAAFAAASMFWAIPSGFSAWDTLAGSATTWNPADKNASVTLSNGNLTAASPSGSYIAARATNSLSSGKAYFEWNWDAITNYSVVGVGNSTASLSNYVGSSSASMGGHDNGTVYGAVGGSYDATNLTSSSAYFTTVRGTQGYSTGKHYFEVTLTANDGTGNPHVGVCTSAASLGNYAAVTNGVDAVIDTGGCYANGGLTAAVFDAISTGGTVGIAVDFGNSKFWVWSSATSRWNAAAIGSQNPATNTGGLSYTYSGTFYPACSPRSHASTQVLTANFGASAFVGAVPAGFAPWNGAAYSLAAVQGVYGLTGYAASLGASHAYSLAAVSGAYGLTGYAAALGDRRAYSLAAVQGSYTLNVGGSSLYGMGLYGMGPYSGASGGAALTYTPSPNKVIAAAAGAYALTGHAPTLGYVRGPLTLVASTGFYSLAGSGVALAKGGAASGLSVPPGQYRLTGGTATMTLTLAINVPPPSMPPHLREATYRARQLGYSFDPSFTIVKDRPGPIRIVEFDGWL